MSEAGTTFTIDTRDAEFFNEIAEKSTSEEPAEFFGRKWHLLDSNWVNPGFHGVITFQRLEQVIWPEDRMPTSQSDEITQAGDGGPAFPSGDGQYGGGPNHDYGMRLRDWFAGQVLAGSAREFNKPSVAAKWAYDVAEAMLKERERT
jgi:hypothetical protein